MSKAVEADTSQSRESINDTSSALSDGVSNEDQSETTEITSDVFELLSNRRRRYSLHYLEQGEETVELGDLARQVASWENDTEVDTVSASERKNVYTSLQQFHLPKLDEKGIVEFDKREGTVELGPVPEDFDIYMEVVERGSVPWSHYYIGLAAVQSLLLGATFAGFVSTTAVSIIFVISLAVSALAHTYYTKTEMRLGTSEKPPEHEP